MFLLFCCKLFKDTWKVEEGSKYVVIFLRSATQYRICYNNSSTSYRHLEWYFVIGESSPNYISHIDLQLLAKILYHIRQLVVKLLLYFWLSEEKWLHILTLLLLSIFKILNNVQENNLYIYIYTSIFLLTNNLTACMV